MRRLLPPVLIPLALLSACSKPPEPALTDAQQAAAVAALPAPFNSADIQHGKAVFQQCKSCHSIAKDAPNMTGPNLYGVYGRVAGSHPNFAYSQAVKSAGFNWDAARLDTWLTNPREDLPGTKMSFVGLREPKDRIDVIGYLRTQSDITP